MWHRKAGIGDVVEAETDALSMNAPSDLSEELGSEAPSRKKFVRWHTLQNAFRNPISLISEFVIFSNLGCVAVLLEQL